MIINDDLITFVNSSFKETLDSQTEARISSYDEEIVRYAVREVLASNNPFSKIGLLISICKTSKIDGNFIINGNKKSPRRTSRALQPQQESQLDGFNLVYAKDGTATLVKKELEAFKEKTIEEKIAEAEDYINRIHIKILDDPALLAKSDKYMLGEAGATEKLWTKKKNEKLEEIAFLKAQLPTEVNEVNTQ